MVGTYVGTTLTIKKNVSKATFKLIKQETLFKIEKNSRSPIAKKGTYRILKKE